MIAYKKTRPFLTLLIKISELISERINEVCKIRLKHHSIVHLGQGDW
jgi:hypothetical protein